MVGLKEMIRVVLACETDNIPLDSIEFNKDIQDINYRYVLKDKNGSLYGFHKAKELYKFCKTENRFFRRYGPHGWNALTKEQIDKYIG